MWKARCRILEWTALALAAVSPAFAQGLYLHVIPATASADVVAEPEAPLRVALTPGGREAFGADLLKALGASEVDGRAVFILDSYPQLGGPVADRHRESTFVVDFDEPQVQELIARLAEVYGADPSVEEIRRFTDEAITVKTMSRGWDLASQAARHGEGDCTEHAVLLTALARSAGRASRVVTGIALVWLDGSVEAYGHAWSEIHDGQAWQRVDATGIDREAPVRYIPLIVIDNEGPGYAFELMGHLVSVWPKKIELSREISADRLE